MDTAVSRLYCIGDDGHCPWTGDYAQANDHEDSSPGHLTFFDGVHPHLGYDSDDWEGRLISGF